MPHSVDRATTQMPGYEARVAVRLLGPFRLLKAGNEVAIRPGSKTEALIGELALRMDIGASRDDLLASIWPDARPSLSAHSLHSLLHGLHRQLGDALEGAAPVVRVGGRYRLNWTAGISSDVRAFDLFADRGDMAHRAGDEVGALAAYADAVRLYRGDLSVGSDVRHVLLRERLRARYLALQAILADTAFRAGDYRTALVRASDLLACDPCREDAHRLVMRCYVRLGQRAQALRQYRTCREILLSEFDAEPESASTELYHQVRLRPGEI